MESFWDSLFSCWFLLGKKGLNKFRTTSLPGWNESEIEKKMLWSHNSAAWSQYHRKVPSIAQEGTSPWFALSLAAILFIDNLDLSKSVLHKPCEIAVITLADNKQTFGNVGGEGRGNMNFSNPMGFLLFWFFLGGGLFVFLSDGFTKLGFYWKLPIGLFLHHSFVSHFRSMTDTITP